MGMVGKGSEEGLGAFSSFLWGVGLSKIQLIMKASVCFVRCSVSFVFLSNRGDVVLKFECPQNLLSPASHMTQMLPSNYSKPKIV